MQRDLECREPRGGRRQGDGQTCHLPGHRQIALETRPRDRQDVRVVVEATVCRLVTRQELLHVHVEPEQVVHGVVVFDAVQSVNRIRGARISRLRLGDSIDLGLEPTGHQVVLGRFRAEFATGGHGAGAQLADDRLPAVRRCGRSVDVQRVERESAALAPLVVAPDAVGIKDLADLRGVGSVGERSGEQSHRAPNSAHQRGKGSVP